MFEKRIRKWLSMFELQRFGAVRHSRWIFIYINKAILRRNKKQIFFYSLFVLQEKTSQKSLISICVEATILYSFFWKKKKWTTFYRQISQKHLSAFSQSHYSNVYNKTMFKRCTDSHDFESTTSCRIRRNAASHSPERANKNTSLSSGRVKSILIETYQRQSQSVLSEHQKPKRDDKTSRFRLSIGIHHICEALESKVKHEIFVDVPNTRLIS